MNLVSQYLVNIFDKHILSYPTNINLTNSWSGGFTLGFFIVMQITTGLLMVPHYIPEVDLAYASVQHIVRDVNNGWMIKFAHANGSSFIFLLMYFHVGRGLFCRSYMDTKGSMVWVSGVIIFILLMAIAFVGYVLPWGQMSYWASVVISSLCTAIPFYGEQLKLLIWGGPNVGTPTLARFFDLHFLLSMLLVGLIFWHIALVHAASSSNPINSGVIDVVRFYPYYFYKDLVAFIFVLGVFGAVILVAPNALSHPENFMKADPLVTPRRIAPEWYFLPFYTILRSIPTKGAGIVAMFSSIIIFILLPKLDVASHTQGSFAKFIYNTFFWFFVLNFLFLGYLGTKPIIYPYYSAGQLCTLLHFLLFILCFIIIPVFEEFLINNEHGKRRKLGFISKWWYLQQRLLKYKSVASRNYKRKFYTTKELEVLSSKIKCRNTKGSNPLINKKYEVRIKSRKFS